MKRLGRVGTTVLVLALGDVGVGRAQQAVDLKALQPAKVTLERALTISKLQGKPISAKFEIEDGKLQLSVYTAKDGKFSEVLVNYRNGKVAKVEPITEGEDLTAARAQSEAMGKAKISLETATTKALKKNSGFRAVRVVPSMESGRAVAAVTLVGRDGPKTVPEILE